MAGGLGLAGWEGGGAVKARRSQKKNVFVFSAF
jgi:hypothetical protein